MPDAHPRPSGPTKKDSHVKNLLALVVVLSGCLTPPAASAGRPLLPADWYRFKAISDLTITSDGSQLAYLVTSYDKQADESRAALWSVDWAGTHSTQLTHGLNVSRPRFRPDGRVVSFLAARSANAATQLWAVDRQGGTPRQLTHVKNEITDYAWSPDGRRVALVMEGDGGTQGDDRAPKPLVIDSFHFKEDKENYLTADTNTHLYLLEVKTGACTPLTSETSRADTTPSFSRDGTQIAYVSSKNDSAADVGREEVTLLALTAGAKPRALTSIWSPNHQTLQWTADGGSIAFLHGDEAKYSQYAVDQLAVLDVASGHVRQLAPDLDRWIYSPRLSADDKVIRFAVEDDGYQYPAQASLAGGAIERLGGPMVAEELVAAAGHIAVRSSSDAAPVEVYALEQGRLRALSAHNRALFQEITLGSVQDFSFKSRDGTAIHGQIVKPPDFQQGHRYPTILWIHGGPDGQDDHSLELEGYSPPLERQLFASHGYVVLAINYRGGTGRGTPFARSIFADWGDKEVQDLLSGVDYAIGAGIADPAHLGVGGWSYGGILTDHIIASDTRFKAAISGAGSANQTAMYGADEYIAQYNTELGPPWRDTALWLKVSYPFFHADRIRTPTLFMGGDKDFDVPLAGGEQMYQALRTLGVPAQLVVYPGEYHVFTRPSYLVDRSMRYLAWMDKYLKAGP
jgi:dipeptidyl aminopeptidase/acylaminoacyl peptidase